MGFLGQGRGVPHEARQQSDDGLGDRQRGHLAPVEDIVPEGDLADLAEGRRVVDDPLVDAFVTPTGEHQVLDGWPAPWPWSG